MDVNGNFSVNNGGGETFNISGDMVNFAGNVDLSNLDTFTVTTSTAVFDGTTNLTSNSLVLNNVTIGAGGSLTTADNMDIEGNFTVTNGGGETFNISDDQVNFASDLDFTNLDTFTVTNSTVVLDGTNQQITGSATFNNFTKIATGADTLTFDNTAAITINGTLILQGQSDSTRLLLRSDVDGQKWEINPQGTVTVSNLDVKDSNNTSGTDIDCATGCQDAAPGSTNTAWIFVVVNNNQEESPEEAVPERVQEIIEDTLQTIEETHDFSNNDDGAIIIGITEEGEVLVEKIPEEIMEGAGGGGKYGKNGVYSPEAIEFLMNDQVWKRFGTAKAAKLVSLVIVHEGKVFVQSFKDKSQSKTGGLMVTPGVCSNVGLNQNPGVCTAGGVAGSTG